MTPASIPSVSDPRILVELLYYVARGARETVELALLLDLAPATVRNYARAASWFGWLEQPEHGVYRLERRGLELAYAGKNWQRRYAEAVREHPFVASLLSAGTLDRRHLARRLQREFPRLSRSTASRKAVALQGLLAPVLDAQRRRRESRGVQLPLGLPRPRPPVTGDRRLPPDALDHPGDPAVYRLVLQLLLDEGELSLSALSAELGRLGVRAPLGSYVEMALRRGDAWRRELGDEDRLVVTPGAVARRDLSDTVASVALSDPDYRAYLDVLRRTERGNPAAAVQYPRLRERFRSWDRRLFGEADHPRAIARSLDRQLLGRPLEAFPLARPTPQPASLRVGAPFLELALEEREGGGEEPALGLVALPPSLDLCLGGLEAVNRALEERRGRSTRSGPSPVEPRVAVHGGLLHPGEPPLQAVADAVSLRRRAVSRVPHLAVLSALLLAHRVAPSQLKLRFRRGELLLVLRGRVLGHFLALADELLGRMGWVVSRRYRGGMEARTLLDLAEVLGIATRLGSLVVLDEDFFYRLQREPAERELQDALESLLERLDAALEAQLEAGDEP